MNSKSLKDLVILALAISVIAAAFVVWREHQRVLDLQAKAIEPRVYGELKRRLAESDERIRELNQQIATQLERSPAGGNTRRDFGGRFGQRGDVRALMDQPEMQRLRALEQKAGLDNRFAALFKALKLPAATLDKLKDLLVEKEVTMQDMMIAAREHGMDPRSDPDGFRELISSAQEEADSAIKSLLGDGAFTQYQQYQQSLPQRAVVNQLQQSLSYTNEPLSEAQASSLMEILAATSTAANGATDVPPFMPSAPGPGPGGGGFGPRAVITPEAVTLLQTVLSAAQMQVLQQLQQAQEAQGQLFRTIRDNVDAGGPGR